MPEHEVWASLAIELTEAHWAVGRSHLGMYCSTVCTDQHCLGVHESSTVGYIAECHNANELAPVYREPSP
jgi:hypothetical protein